MFKKIAGKIHLWLGFASGLVLVLSLLPAAIFVFQVELTNWWYHDTIFANKVNEKPLPVSSNDHSGWDEGDSYEYDPKNGVLKQQTRQEFKNTAAKLQNSIYGIHTGSIYGMPTKILVFFGTLFCASLPVTGFIIWWGRGKKEKKPVVKSKQVSAGPKPGYVPRRAMVQK